MVDPLIDYRFTVGRNSFWTDPPFPWEPGSLGGDLSPDKSTAESNPEKT